MRALTLDSFDSAPRFRDDLPIPTVGADDLLVGVQASSVNPADAVIASGMLKGMAEYEFPVTLGRDFAGVVEQVGANVTQHAAGDAVYGFVFVTPVRPCTREAGRLYAVVPQGWWGGSGRVDVASAGVTPVAGLTAIAGLDALELSSGESVLIIGATGGVGSSFVQLAAAAGALVIAPAHDDDREYLDELGVSDVLERDSDLIEQVRDRFPEGVDALLDLVSFAPDASVLKEARAAGLPPWCGRRGARTRERHGIGDYREPRASRDLLGYRCAAREDPRHVSARASRQRSRHPSRAPITRGKLAIANAT